MELWIQTKTTKVECACEVEIIFSRKFLGALRGPLISHVSGTCDHVVILLIPI